VPVVSNDKPVDVVLIGGGIMGITLEMLIEARLEHPALWAHGRCCTGNRGRLE